MIHWHQHETIAIVHHTPLCYAEHNCFSSFPAYWLHGYDINKLQASEHGIGTPSS